MKKTNIKRLLTWLAISILAGFTLLLLIPISPYYHFFPGRDSSIFIYSGLRVLAGEVPYQSVWDHKGPIIYFINALGLSLLPQSFWGIWLVEVVSLMGALLFGYFALSELFGRTAAISGLLVGFSSFPKLIFGGNFTEEYSLLPLFGALYFFSRAVKRKKYSFINFLLIGCCLGYCFWLRPNNIGLIVSMMLALVVGSIFNQEIKNGLRQVSLVSLGFIVFSTPIFIYFALNNALYDFIDGVFIYNFSYIDVHKDWVQSVFTGIDYFQVPLFLSVIAIIIALYSLSQNSMEKTRPNSTLFVFQIMLVFAMPFDILLTSISGRSFQHYYMIWIPAATLSTTYFFYHFFAYLKTMAVESSRPMIKWRHVLALAAVSFSLIVTLHSNLRPSIDFIKVALFHRENMVSNRNNQKINDIQTAFLKRNILRKNDYLLVWGNGVIYNLVTHKDAPSRYIYIYPLLVQGYTTSTMVNEFLADIIEKDPLILDVALTNSSAPALSSDEWDAYPELIPVRDYILQNYEVLMVVGPDDYPLYIPMQGD